MRKLSAIFLCCSVSCFLIETASQAKWPQWRGPAANTVVSGGDFPQQFSPTNNMLWKVDLKGDGGSTPAVWEDAIFVTIVSDGKDTLCSYDLDGNEKWRLTLDEARKGKHRSGTGSNPSPVTDGTHVVSYFKSGLVLCTTLDGKELWRKNLQDEYGKDTLWWDLGTSPVLTSMGVVIAVVQEGNSYLVSLDPDSGEQQWKQDRMYETAKESDQSYATPSVVPIDGIETVVTWGADHLTGHDAKSGELLWECGGFNSRNEGMWRTIASVTVADGTAYVPFGRGSHLAAVELGGSGDITESSRRWEKVGQNIAADVPSPVCAEGKLYLLSDNGQVSCRDAETGSELWSDRLPRGRAKFFSTPLLAGNKLYCVRENGSVFVIDVSEGFDLVAENELGERMVATPVPVDETLLLRTRSSLFRFGKN